MKNLMSLWSLLLLMGLILACSSSKTTQTGEKEGKNATHDKQRPGETTYVIEHPQSLADFLVKVPGVFVDDRGGNTIVTIRGSVPLFVIDGLKIGRSYASAERAVSVYDIESVRVLKDLSETAIYGDEGRNGVIFIKTKRSL